MSQKEFVEHNLIKDESIEKREYQDYLFGEAKDKSSLVVLPTGTGKTIVSLRITAERILENGGTSLLLAPTKPLVEQHYETYMELLDIMDDEIIIFTGDTRPDERKDIWDSDPSVVVATPQVIENDVIAGRISFQDVTHLTIDECHRATGDYSYVYLADKYKDESDNSLITGLSASPGDNKEEILTICKNINVESINIITEDDPKIKDYTYKTSIETRWVDIDDEILDIRDKIQDVYKNRLEKLYEEDYIDSRSKTVPQSKLHSARNSIQNDMQKGNSDAYQAMSIWAETMKLNKAIETIETQGVDSFLEYYKRIESELNESDSSKAVERLVSDKKMQSAVNMARSYDSIYNKYDALKSELVTAVKINGGKALVFTKSRDTVESIVELLSDDFVVNRLVGQTDKENSEGMKQYEQKESVREFSNDEAEVLVSTQIGEEGLDISEVDMVVFYEPASKGIEQIQRQGRTGRSKSGRVVMLIGNETRDVGMYYKSKNNVKQMKDDVSDLQEIGDLEVEIREELEEEKKQTKLSDTFDNNSNSSEVYSIVADSRESKSSVVKSLDTSDNVDLNIKNNMEIGDYIVSDQCVVERKSVQDFHDTITGDRSIFEQIKNMSNEYNKPVLLIEGGHGGLYTKNIHPNSIRGILASIVSDFGVSIIESVDEDDTASILQSLAEKEQDNSDSKVNPHGNKETGSIKSQQEYIVSSIEGIGIKTARELLNEFDDIYSIFNADIEDLENVDGIGEGSANKIYRIIRSDYSN
jgi:Fanconi anemia group M protein